MPLLDTTGETGHRGVGTEPDAGGGGGDENGLALTEGHDVLLAVILMVNKAAASGDAHHDHKRVQFREILGARLVQVEERGGEVLAADQFGLGVLDAGIFSPVVRVDIVVDGLLGLLDVQFAGLSVKTQATIVIDPVGQVGCLLDLGDEGPGPDGVDAAGREEEHIAGSDPVACKHVGDGVFVDSLLIFIGSDPLGQTAQQMGSLVGSDHIPHLGLAFHPRMGLRGKLVVRVDLDRQVASSVDKFDQERELRTGLLKNLLADEFRTIFIHHIGQAFACKRAVGYR